jgi:hypothetical protein
LDRNQGKSLELDVESCILKDISVGLFSCYW